MSASAAAVAVVAHALTGSLATRVRAVGRMLHRQFPSTVMRHITAAMIDTDILLSAVMLDRHGVLQHWAEWNMRAMRMLLATAAPTASTAAPKPLLDHLIDVAIQFNSPWCLRVLLRLAQTHRPLALLGIPVSMLAHVAARRQGRLFAVLVAGLKDRPSWARMIAADKTIPEFFMRAVKQNHPTMVDGIAHLCTAHIPRMMGVCAIATNRAHILAMLLEHVDPREHRWVMSCALWLAAVCNNTRAMSVLLTCGARHGMQLNCVHIIPDVEALQPLARKMLAAVCVGDRDPPTTPSTHLERDIHLIRVWMVFACTHDKGPAFELLRQWVAVADPGVPYLPPRFVNILALWAAKNNSASVVAALLAVHYSTVETGPHMVRFGELAVIKMWLLALRRGHIRVLDVLLDTTPPDVVAKGLSPAIMIREATWRRAGRCMLARRTVDWVMDKFIGCTDQRYLSASAGACVY